MLIVILPFTKQQIVIIDLNILLSNNMLNILLLSLPLPLLMKNSIYIVTVLIQQTVIVQILNPTPLLMTLFQNNLRVN